MEIQLRTFTEPEYHAFFRHYEPDLWLEPPFVYNQEQVSRSYAFNHGGYQTGYAHYGIFLENQPVGSFQLKRMRPDTGVCEFGIILLNEDTRGRGIGPQAIQLGMDIAREEFGMKIIRGDTAGRNLRMQRVFWKLGFTCVERVNGAITRFDGEKDDRLIYERNLDEPKELK